MFDTAPPPEAVWQILSDVQTAQQTSTRIVDERLALSGLGYAYAFGALAEAAIENGSVDRKRLLAWLQSAAADADAAIGNELTTEILDRLCDVIETQAISRPAD